jgi:hypothetical protein
MRVEKIENFNSKELVSRLDQRFPKKQKRGKTNTKG